MFARRLTFALLLSLAAALPAQPTEQKSLPPAEDDSETLSRAVPVFDPGAHTRPICTMGFTSDKSKLVTVGEDFTVQVWSATTGERLDILRLPPYGHEQGDNPTEWDVAVITNDGRMVALGGGPRKTWLDTDKSDQTKLVLVDVFRRTVRPVNGPGGQVTALDFSADGQRLAAAFSSQPQEIYIYSDLGGRADRPVRRRKTQVLNDPKAQRSSTILRFSPDGNRLLAAVGMRDVTLWDLRGGEPRLVKNLELQGVTTSACWSPDGQRFARTWIDFNRKPHGFEVRTADGEPQKEFLFPATAPFSDETYPYYASFTGPHTLLLHSHDGRGTAEPGPSAVHFDLKSGKGSVQFQETSPGRFPAIGALSQDRELAAITASMGLDAVIYRVRDGAVVARCGAASPIPTVVGWSAPGRPAGFAWSEDRKSGRNNTETKDLQFGFDLSKMEPLAEARPADYGVGQLTIGPWSVLHVKNEDVSNEFSVVHDGKSIGVFRGGTAVSSFTLIPRGDDPPLVAWSARRSLKGSGNLTLSKADGTLYQRLRPTAVYIRDMAPSPDGRFLIASTGTHRLCVYTTGGAPYPLISVARVRGEWVAWSGEGYYTASPGGEKMFGWAVSNGSDALATFHTAEKFSKHFRRPDLLQRAVELGSMKLALQRVEARAPNVEQILPPKSELKLLKQTGARVEVRAAATSGAKDKPVQALRVLLDGRPLSGGKGYKVLKAGEPAEAIWELDIPAGDHELKLLARSVDGSEASEPLLLRGPKSADQQPVLYRLCIGVDKYDRAALNLTSAAKDAKDVFAALEQHCVGINNRFGSARGTLLIDKQATRDAVLKAVAEMRQSAKPGDLVVILFAGHGIKQQNEYYLLTREANPSENLQGRSLSGADLRQALADMGCPVLLLMDACHSAGGVKSFRPATDDLTRSLTDDATGVTVMAAAMAHEVASATEENGYFTAAFLKALKVEDGVPFDSYSHALYTHHIYSVVFSEVRKATNGKQNPFLNMPWTVPPLAIRDVPQK